MMKAWIVERGIYFQDTSEVFCICPDETLKPTRAKATAPRKPKGGREVKMLACGGGGGGGGGGR